MKELVSYIIKNIKSTEELIINELYEICEITHSCCDDDCPVFYLNNHSIPNNNNLSGCDCFKSGQYMFNFIKDKISNK